MLKTTGSPEFGTSVMRTDECILMAQVMRENGMTPEQSALDMECIDDLLAIQRMESIIRQQRFTKTGKLRKNASLEDLLSNRIDVLIKESK